MNRIQRGRGGWVVDARGLTRATGIALLMMGLALGGCSSKQKKPGEGAAGGPGSGLGEGGIGSGGGSSLGALQNGTLGANGSGPLADIHFDYNESTIRPQDNDVLRAGADYMTSHPGTRVQVEGHCDDRGSEEYNIALGARRAQAAKDYLATLGIGADRMSTISYGKELPLCTEETEDCWAENRRDHFALSQ
jgi:peptidoglycan-associated lipoprotein